MEGLERYEAFLAASKKFLHEVKRLVHLEMVHLVGNSYRDLMSPRTGWVKH